MSPGISTMLSKPPDQKPLEASLLTTEPLARTTYILPLSAFLVGPTASRKYRTTVLTGRSSKRALVVDIAHNAHHDRTARNVELIAILQR